MCKHSFLLFLSIAVITGCEREKSDHIDRPVWPDFVLGADLSYLNEMTDCGAIYRKNGETIDPWNLFATEGANLVRLRLWHNPTWTNYSTFEDVKKSIRTAFENRMPVMLDFHYSDDWADPANQIIPAAWNAISSNEILGDSLYNYTYKTLMTLNDNELLPHIVQIGNEINTEILMPLPSANYSTINWSRNIYLLNRGLQAVKQVSTDTGQPIMTMIHIAQPENTFWWFKEAFENGIDDFDWIGISYYPIWSDYGLPQLSQAIDSLKSLYSKRIMIVETAYPHTSYDADNAGNIIGTQDLLPEFQATPIGQKQFLLSLAQHVADGGGEGVIYWEPAWVSTNCSTRWGVGSHWDNATFFDARNSNEKLDAFQFFHFESKN